jgi:hypothetical protein
MSIRTEIQQCIGTKLEEFPNPLGPGLGPRRLFVSSNLAGILTPAAWDSSPEGKCFVAAYTRLGAFVRNRDIPFAWNPDRKPPGTAFARVKPVDLSVVAVRVWHKRTHLRMLGCFSEKDWLILLRWDFRTGLNFTKEANECRQDWAALFTIAPLKGNSVHDYLSDRVVPV